MAWLAVDKDGTEYIYNNIPVRDYELGTWENICNGYEFDCIELPKGSIEKLINKKLTWEDAPIKLE